MAGSSRMTAHMTRGPRTGPLPASSMPRMPIAVQWSAVLLTIYEVKARQIISCGNFFAA